ncbi:MAG TPA: histidine kinase N-terminal 7TM domain-containing protein [Anaerolineae bacterium]|nr:histidine kinase N-terminal 7TM domain-containing protein [Anaerolineae bacterium]
MVWIMVYVMTAFLSAALTLLLAAYAWRHREAAGATGFVALMVSVTLWSVLVALEALSETTFARDFWRNLKYIGLAVSPVALLLFALQSIGSRWLTWRRTLPLFIIPLITQVMIWTNAWHHFWTIPDVGRGVWFWVHSTYSFTLVFISLILVAIAIPYATPLRRRQLATILLGLLAPLIVNILHTFAIIPYVVDFTPIAFTFGGVLFAWTMYRHKLFDLTPLAREVVIDEMTDGMLVLDKAYRVADYNPAVQAILNLPTGDLRGWPIADLMPMRAETLDMLISQPQRLDEWTLTRGTEEYHYEAHLSPLYDRQQSLAGYVLLLHNITARKQAERVIQQYAHELETRNTELEARNAELDAFAHTVAHDLKNPLSALIGFSTMVEQRFAHLQPEKVLEHVQRITQIGNKITNIINELLLLSSVRKMEQVECQPLDMQAVVAEALERFEVQIDETHAQIQVASEWPVAVGYAPWVEEVWVNYLSNALKYGGRPEAHTPPHVELGFSPLNSGTPENPKSEILFWVRDNGPGLSAEAQSKLFAEFTRLEQTRAKGHGLGLSIVRRIVEKLGGAVGVESFEGQGSTFWFTLPAAA